MTGQVRGVNVAVTRLGPSDYPGKIAELRVGASYLHPGVERLDETQVDDLIGLLQRCMQGRASE